LRRSKRLELDPEPEPPSFGHWKLAWGIATVVVAIAAGLLLTIIGLARRIAAQATEIGDGLETTRENTRPLFDIASVNRNLDRIAGALGIGK
jgi:small neutral amino acid transporter SnatA (MarC family)